MKSSKLFALISIVFVSTSAIAQPYLLLDRRWSKPAIESDTVSKSNLSEGLFPIYKTDLDTLLTMVLKFKNLKDDGLNRKFYYSEDFKTPQLEFQIENIKRAFGDGYEINLISKGSFGTATVKLSDPRNSLPANQKVIRSFISYLERTRADLLNPPKNKKKK